jgi:hypothetical protein
MPNGWKHGKKGRKMAAKKTVYKSAKSGKFVKKGYAKKHPATTFGERVRVGTRRKKH